MLTGLIILLILVAVILHLVPMDAQIKGVIIKIVIVAALLVFVVWILQLLGVSLPGVRLP